MQNQNRIVAPTPTYTEQLGLLLYAIDCKPTAEGRLYIIDQLRETARLADLQVAAQKATPPPLYTKPREKHQSIGYKQRAFALAADLSARVEVVSHGDYGTVEVFAPDGYRWSDGPSSLLAEYDPTDWQDVVAIWRDVYERMLDGLEPNTEV